MVKSISYKKTFLPLVCSLFSLWLTACSPVGPHKPIAPAAGGSGGGDGGGVGAAGGYSAVRPLFAQYCARCHNASSGLPNWMDQGTAEARRARIAERLSATSDAVRMPQASSPEAAAMKDSDRTRLLTWARSSGESERSAPQINPPAPGPDLKELLKSNPAQAVTAFVQRCSGCHGSTGTSMGPAFPNLASHDPDYIVARLNGFFTPESPSLMAVQLRNILSEFGLTYENKAGLEGLFQGAAKHFSGQKLAISLEQMQAARAKLSAADQALYEKGKAIVSNGSCVACHVGDNDRPAEGFPMVFGQGLDYLKKRLPEEQNMPNADGSNPMPEQLKDLSADDLNALAVYLSHTHISEAKP